MNETTEPRIDLPGNTTVWMDSRDNTYHPTGSACLNPRQPHIRRLTLNAAEAYGTPCPCWPAPPEQAAP